MNITTREQLQEQMKSSGTVWLVVDNLCEEVIIDRIPYLSDGQYGKTIGDAVLLKESGEEVRFKMELDKPIEGVDLRTEPDDTKDIEHLKRVSDPTADQVNEAIGKLAELDDREDFGYEVETMKFLPRVGEVEFVEHVGGEGEGDHTHVVFKVSGKLFKLDGFYSSWEGTEWEDSVYAVKPKEVKVIQYEAI